MSLFQRVSVACLLIACRVFGNEAAVRTPPPPTLLNVRQTDVEAGERITGSTDSVSTNTAPASVVTLDSLTNRFKVVSVSEESGITTWKTVDTELRFFDGSRRLEFNGTLLWMNGATTTNAITNMVKQANGTNSTSTTVIPRAITQADAETVIAALLTPPDPTGQTDPFIVILDPGHGGNDPGASVVGNPPEKDLVLDVAKRVRQRLKQAGVKVRMTRSGDQTLTLPQRPAFARKNNGSIVVSIHANKASRSSARGIETFVLTATGFPSTADTKPVMERFPGNRHDSESLQLGYFIQRELIDQTKTIDRGVKRARFEVLRLTPCPAALVEIGFLSNAAERKKLSTNQYRDQIADGIALGIRIYSLQNRSQPASGSCANRCSVELPGQDR